MLILSAYIQNIYSIICLAMETGVLKGSITSYLQKMIFSTAHATITHLDIPRTTVSQDVQT